MRRIIAAMLAVLAPGVAWGQGTPTFQTLTTTGNAAVGGTLSVTAPGGVGMPTPGGWPITRPAPILLPVSQDMNPGRHLSNLIGKTSATACIIGDSTATPGPDSVGTNAPGTINGVDPSQMVWAFLGNKLRADNPQITTWSFQNFAIGATTENQPLLTGTVLANPNTPAWFTDLSQTWFSYVQAASCDVLFWQFGTNAASAGYLGGVGTQQFIRQDFENIDTWAKVPNVVIVTTKSANPATDNPTFDDANSSAHKAQAAFHRTFARTDAAGYTSFPLTQAKGFGLVDLGRYFTARMDGYDPAAQYMQSKPSCLASGVAMVAQDIAGTGPSTVCTTTHGDFRLTFVMPGAGGTTLFGYGGSNTIRVSAGMFNANYLRLSIGGGGNIVPRYVLDGNSAGAPTITGTSVATSAGQDVFVTVSASGERFRVWIQDALALDIAAPRTLSDPVGGMPVNVGFATAPTGSPTMNITEFYEGIGAPTTDATNYGEGFGIGTGATSCNASLANCQGGNSINHQRSNSAAIDHQVIDALDFRAPVLTATPFYGFTRLFSNVGTSGNAADTTADILGTCNYTVPANQLASVGDTLHVVAAGNFAASGDTKVARVQINGVSLSGIVGNAVGQTSWQADVLVKKSGSSTQDTRGTGNSTGVAPISQTGPQTFTDSSTMALLVTGQNTSAATGNSITCTYMTVDMEH